MFYLYLGGNIKLAIEKINLNLLINHQTGYIGIVDYLRKIIHKKEGFLVGAFIKFVHYEKSTLSSYYLVNRIRPIPGQTFKIF
jgi:hypothetical protein